MVLFQKLFQGYIFCFLGDSFGQCIFEQYARETNLKKKRSVYGEKHYKKLQTYLASAQSLALASSIVILLAP